MFKHFSIYLCCAIGIINTQIDDFYNNNNYGLQQLGARRSRPEIRLYYETRCPHCMTFYSQMFANVVKRLGPYLDIHTYPYGKTTSYPLKNGSIAFECQHGPEECYGNKLHACALNNIGNHLLALLFNGCMMESGRPNSGSNDASADQCGAIMNIDTRPIKICAKTDMGSQLLYHYGQPTAQEHLRFVPKVLINGAEWTGTPEVFMKDVCAAFTSPPSQCISLLRA